MASARQGAEQVGRPSEVLPDVHNGLFSGKLRIPPVSHPHVLRPRLHELCEAGVRAGSLVVCAPAGSGKTQLVAAWARRQASPRDVAWLTLDEADRDPARFVKYAVAAVHATSAGRRVMEGLAARAPLTEINEPYLVAVADAMSRLPGPVVLVLDDFQAVAHSATELLLERIMRYPPEQVRLVVLSRTEPALGGARLRLQGLLLELGAEELAFTAEETASLFRAHGTELGDTELASVMSRTRGWATGLQVVAASRGRAAEPAAHGTSTVGESLAVDFLMEQVFEDQPPEIQQFLLRAGITDQVCGDLADALTGQVGGGRTLADLHRAHVFLDSLEEMRSERCQWFRWHPMFASMLRTRLHAADPDLARELHARASRWFRSQGFVVEAIRHSVAAGDVEGASTLLGETWLELVVAGEAAVVRSLLALFDDRQRVASAELAVVAAFDAAQARNLDVASRWAEHAGRLAADLPQNRREPVEAMATVIRLHAASMTGADGDALRASALRALHELEDPVRSLTPADRRRRVLLLHHLGDLEASLWMHDEPLEHLTEAIAQAAALDMPSIVLRCRVHLASIDFFAGRLGRAQRVALDVLGEAESHGWHGQHHLASAHLVLGGVDLLHGDLDAAVDRLAAARALVHPADQVTAFRIGFLTQLSLRTAGRITAARAETEALQRQVATWQAPDWARVLLAVAEAEQLAAEGRPEPALGCAESVAGLATAPVANRHWRAFYGRLLLVVGEPAAARAIVAPLVTSGGSWPSQILALVTDAVAADCLGLREEALDTLVVALRTAGKESIVQPFLAVGPRLRPLLDALVQAGSVYDKEALAILDHLEPAHGGRGSNPLVEPLTPREMEVLRAMQGAASNQEIAAQLFVSANTLRSHIKQVYRKLGARNRWEAVARARDLGLV